VSMRLVNPFIAGSIRQQFDPDAQRYIESVNLADGNDLEPAIQIAINNFVLGCKQDAIWDAIKASCILAGARTLNGALTPLAGAAPTNPAGVFTSASYDRKTGLVGNGTTQYLNTNRLTSADAQDNHHYSVYATSTTNTTAGIIGGRSSAANVGTKQFNWVASTGSEFRCASSAASTISAVSPASGFYGASRSASSSFIAKASNLSQSFLVSSDGLNSADFFVFARNTSGTAEIYSNWKLSFYSIGESLNLALLDARVAALMTAISAAIP